MTATHGILVAVVALVLIYFFRCRHLILSDHPRTRLEGLRDRLVADMDSLVASGHKLEWVYYSDEAQRKHEDLREQLRNYGTISLATGVGGTMAALAVHLLLLGDAPQDDALGELLGEMGWALVAAGAGVVGNLAILWGLLPWANRRFNPELDHFLGDLRREEAERRGQPDKLSQATAEIIGDRLGEELRGMITRVPGMFERLGGTAAVLARAADKLGADLTQLTSATGSLVSTTSTLNRMPRDLDAVLGKALQDLRTWESERQGAAAESHANLHSAIERMGSLHHEAAEKMDTTARAVASEVNNAAANLSGTTRAVRQSFEDLPDLVATAIEGSGRSLGREFSDLLAPQVATLRDGISDGLAKTVEWQNAVSEHLDELRMRHGRAIHDLVTRTADVVATVQVLPDAVADSVKESSERLGRVFGHENNQHVEQLRSVLREDAEKLQDQLQRHESHLLNTTVQELRSVSEKLLNKIVRDLEGISVKLAAVLEGFPEHVTTVNTGLDDTDSKLRDIAARIDEASLALRDAHEKTGDMLAGLRTSTEEVGQAIQRFAESNEQAIRELKDVAEVPQRMGWWRRIWRRGRNGNPSATSGRGAA